jgi:hypothetical protein
MSLPLTSTTANSSILKPKNKRKILPKKSLIQLYIKSPQNASKTTTTYHLPTSFYTKTATNTPAESTNYLKQPSLSTSSAVASAALASNSDPHQNEYSFTSTTSTLASTQNQNLIVNNNNKLNSKLKCIKEKKMQEITRLYLDHKDQQKKAPIKRKQSLVLNHLAKEFLLDCRQRMEANSFRVLLKKLADHELSSQLKEPTETCEATSHILNYIYELIKLDRNLCNKFSAFLTEESSLKYDLLNSTIQYEKCFEFFSKLEHFMPNKCTFKK